jgi:hypothetical protein
MAELQDVFKTAGVPTVTFVKPLEYPRLILNLRTAGRGLIIEGPSGIGKTTAILKAIEELGLSDRVLRLSARKKDDLEYISLITEMQDFGIALIDDFHKLSADLQEKIANIVKVFADEGSDSSKLIVLGINEAGKSLIQFAPDLVNRIDIIRFENSTDDKVTELIEKGERELNVIIDTKANITKEASGGFYIAQMICSEICLHEGILATALDKKVLAVSFEGIKFAIWRRLSNTFYDICKAFALGARYRPEGRAPYLHLLYWLATSGEWVLNIPDAMRNHSEMRLSVGQVVEKGYLAELFEKTEGISSVLHFDGRNIAVEDPQFVFYIRNMPWARFAKNLGFRNIEFKNRYDFALSFAGSDRGLAERLFEALTEEEFSVFYDKNEQYRILASNIEEYLEPIYQSEARFVICILSPSYPTKIWTTFEAKHFAKRIELGEVLPIVVDDTNIDVFSSLSKIGHLSYNTTGDKSAQLTSLVATLKDKISVE